MITRHFKLDEIRVRVLGALEIEFIIQGLLAQLVEHLVEAQGVAGSIPAETTT